VRSDQRIDEKPRLKTGQAAALPAGKALMEGLVTGMVPGFTNVVHGVTGLSYECG